MSEKTEIRNYFLLGLAIAIVAAICASLLTMWVKTYEPEPTRPEAQIFEGIQVEALARLGVDRLEVKKIHPMGAKPVFQLKLHQAGKVTGYRGFYPDTVDMVIDILPGGQAKADYTGKDPQEFHEDHLVQIGEFFLVKAVEVADKVQAFDGRVIGGSRIAAAAKSAIRE